MTQARLPARGPGWRRLLAQRRNRWLLGVLLVLIGVRLALPSIVRRVVVDQADKALVGRIELDDVSFALTRGRVAVHGFRVFSTEASPAPNAASPSTPPVTQSAPGSSADEGPPGTAPVFSAKDLTVELGFRALLRKTIELRRITLDGFALSLDRAKDGTLMLPVPAPAATEEKRKETDAGPGWGVLIQRVTLRDGRLRFRDFAISDSAQRVEAKLPLIDARQLALQAPDTGAEPGKVTLDAAIQDGTLHLEATIAMREGGPTFESHVTLANVPIGDARLYVPDVGWSTLAGRLDTDLVHRFESRGAHTLQGTVSLRDLAIHVQGLDDPALAWRALGIEIGGIDFLHQNADIASVTLTGARVVTKPAGPEPVPVLRRLVAAVDRAHHGSPPAESPPAEADLPEPTPAPAAPQVDTSSPRPWTWTLRKAVVADGHLEAIGGDGSLEVGLEAEVASLASAPNTHTTVRVTLASSGGGTATLAGDLTRQPLAFDGTLRTEGLVLPPLTQPVATATSRLLKGGIASVDLTIAAGETTTAPSAGVRLSGTIELDDLAVAGDDPKTFALRWKALTIGLDELTAPGVFAAQPGPLGIALSRLTLGGAGIVLARTEHGLALPAAMGGKTSAAPTATTNSVSPPPPSTVPPAAPTPPPAVDVRVDHLTIEKMRVSVTDQTVKPFYRSIVDPIDLSAADVRWPDLSANNLILSAKGVDGGTLTVTGELAPRGSQLLAKLDGLPLAPFNPYTATSGYGIGGGTVTLVSKVELRPGAYDTSSKLVLNALDVRGGEGDTLFAERFGVPLSLALSLMTDLQGNIVLDLPITGDKRGAKTNLGTLIENALVRAILNAVTSPLKLIGAVANIGDKPSSLAPQPIAFQPGRDALVIGESAKLEQLSRVLSSSPGLRLHLRGEASAADRRWLQEQAFLRKLQEESGVVGSVRYIAERAARKAALATLTARAEGKPDEIPPAHRDWFEAQVTAQPVADAGLQQLAEARAKWVQSEIASEQDVAVDRLVLDATRPEDLNARSAVAIGLGSAPVRK